MKRWKNPKHGKTKQINKTVLPSKFLLGGNIRDPLNLNSLADDKVSKVLNAMTPESSPLPTPKHRKAEYKIEVLIPPNISDPLNLNCGVDENEYEAKLISPGGLIAAAAVPSGGQNGGTANKANQPANQNPTLLGSAKKKKFRYRKRVRSSSNKKDMLKNAEAFEPESDEEEHPGNPDHVFQKKARAESLDEATTREQEERTVEEPEELNEKSRLETSVKEKKGPSAAAKPAVVPPPTSASEKSSGNSKPPHSTSVQASKANKANPNQSHEKSSAASSEKKDKKSSFSKSASVDSLAKSACASGSAVNMSKKNVAAVADLSDIVSPVLPQPGQKKGYHQKILNEKANQSKKKDHDPESKPKYHPKNKKFEYGNYNRYYGYRNPNHDEDIRLRYLKPEWFRGKDVLDIGCNVGHIAMTISKTFEPKSVIGMDIDKSLVEIAKKNIRHYSSCDMSKGKRRI